MKMQTILSQAPCRKCGETGKETRIKRRVCRDCERLASAANAFKNIRGITYEQRDAMLEAQGGKCKACNTSEAGSVKGWHVDHCHRTLKIRGVLCATCNIALGQVDDSVDRLYQLIAYLQGEGATTIPTGSTPKRVEAHGSAKADDDIV